MIKSSDWDFRVFLGAAIGFFFLLFLLFVVKDVSAFLVVLLITFSIILLANNRLVNKIRKFFGKKPLED